MTRRIFHNPHVQLLVRISSTITAILDNPAVSATDAAADKVALSCLQAEIEREVNQRGIAEA